MKNMTDYCAAETEIKCAPMSAALEEVKHDSSCVKVAEKTPCFVAKKLF